MKSKIGQTLTALVITVGLLYAIPMLAIHHTLDPCIAVMNKGIEEHGLDPTAMLMTYRMLQPSKTQCFIALFRR